MSGTSNSSPIAHKTPITKQTPYDLNTIEPVQIIVWLGFGQMHGTPPVLVAISYSLSLMQRHPNAIEFNHYESKTLSGRVLTVLLAVATTLFVASFTAILASTFTMERLRSNITGPADLSGLRVGVKSATTTQPALDALGDGYMTFATVPEMLDALAKGQLDAIVADDPVLRYENRSGTETGQYRRLIVLPYQFNRQNYGLVLSENLTILEEIDRAALAVKASGVWAERIGRYLGMTR